MNIQRINLTNQIHLLVFDSQLNITSTFLRFQEHYESPEFRDKFFTLEEYKKWYIKEKGSFTYFKDWSGFNIPSYILQPFREGKFNPLSKKEVQLLDLFKDDDGAFYIIGIHKGLKNVLPLLTHECAHGLFYTNKEYKTEVLAIIEKYDITTLKKHLAGMSGYHEEVLLDEVHAYAINASKSVVSKVQPNLSKELKAIFEKYAKEEHLNLQKVISSL